MSVQDKSTLKSYFQTGDVPTQSNFEDLVDSSLNLSEANTLQKAVGFTIVNLTVTGSSITVDLSQGNIFYIDITSGSGNFTFDYSNATVGAYYFIFRRAANLAIRNVTWTSAKFKSSFGSLPALSAPTTTVDGEDIVMGIYVNSKMILVQQSNLIGN